MDVVRQYIQIARKNLALFQFILEGYEGMVSVTTLDPRAAMVEISVLPGFFSESMDVLAALQKDFEFKWLSN